MKKFILLASMVLGFSAFASDIRHPKEIFGGEAVQIYVWDDMSATLEFACANATVQPGRWPTGQSRISAVGLYTPMQQPRAQTATFKANIDVNTGKMTLTVKVGNQRAVIYKLIRDVKSQITRCQVR
jgi:hypothetical protein